ncbi:MAG: pyridoxamine 5'-phosphate oxidase [Phycisphaerales bacterium]
MLTEAIAKLLSASDLPEPPPTEPLPLLAAWFEQARASGRYDDHNALALATSTPDGSPSVRMVLAKAIEVERGAVAFYTNYDSRKGRELAANPRVAGVFHWPHAKRQARIEGVVERMTPAESDEYFHSRPLLSRVGACISRQSSEIGSRAELVAGAMSLAKAAAGGTPITRPAQWGGFRIVLTAVELWSGHEGRLHQRVRWSRGPGGVWKHALLAP